MLIMVEAGYVAGAFGVIYQAPIFQPMWEMEDNTTYKVTFRCIDGAGIVYDNFTMLAQPPMVHQKEMVLAMAKNARKPFDIKSMSTELIDNQLPSPRTTTAVRKELKERVHLSLPLGNVCTRACTVITSYMIRRFSGISSVSSKRTPVS